MKSKVVMNSNLNKIISMYNKQCHDDQLIKVHDINFVNKGHMTKSAIARFNLSLLIDYNLLLKSIFN